ncbi:MAG: thiamine pyrophosphate-dependent enzyme [Saprospiraceae bacterium]
MKDIKSYDLKTGDNLTVPGTLNLLRSMMDDDDLLISDVGAHKMWIARNYPCYCPNGCIISNGLASMGISLPGGIAGALLDGNRRVVSVMGDGGALMNIQELETAKRLGISYTVIVFNDNDYGLISWKQERSANRTAGTKISNPDFVKLGESFGWNGYRPTTVADLKMVLEECLNNQELNLIEIPIDASVNQALVQKLKEFYRGK